jgi:hypothetical protein
MLEAGQRPKRKRKVFLGKKTCTRKETDGRKNNTHGWEEELMTIGLGFL